MSEKKKLTAAVSAVMSYLKEEEAAIRMQAASRESVASAGRTAPMTPMGLWAASGRQTQMQMQNMMQLKAFHRLR